MASPISGSAYTFTVSLTSQSNGAILDNPTLATGDVKISTDGGTVANLATLPVVTPASSGVVEVNLTSGEVGTAHFSVLFSDAAGAEWKDLNYHETVQSVGEITAAAVADAVWDEAQADHTTADTFGYYLDARVSAAGGSGGSANAILTAEIITQDFEGKIVQ